MSNISPIPGDDRMVAVTEIEICALVQWHARQCGRITNQVGKMVLTKFSRREARIVIDEGEKMVKAHIARAKELQSILKK